MMFIKCVLRPLEGTRRRFIGIRCVAVCLIDKMALN